MLYKQHPHWEKEERGEKEIERKTNTEEKRMSTEKEVIYFYKTKQSIKYKSKGWLI